MKAGALRRRLVIQVRNQVLSAYYEDLGTWSTFATVYGSIRALGGQERTANIAQQVQATVTHEVRMRYGAAAVTPKMRIVYGAKTLDVESVADPDGRQRELQVLCREVL